MRKTWISTIFFALIAAFVPLSSVSADGIIIPDPPACWPQPCPPWHMTPLNIKYHHVSVDINDQVAVTRVDQVFENTNDWVVEGVYTFPIPHGAVVTNFKLWVDGKPVEGKVLDANAARAEYEQIVRQLRDPALLEYADRGAVMARIFPIAPGDERRIELEYTEALTAENGLIAYRYPLNTEKFSNQPLESVSVTVEITSPSPVLNVYSPTHPVRTSTKNPNHWLASYEESQVKPDQDFLLYYSVGTEEGIHLLTYRNLKDAADPDGYFLMMVTPPAAVDEEVLPKNLILILDHSGSMEGEKFRQAISAARFILQHLNPNDYFNIISFSSGVETFAPYLQPTENRTMAEAWLDGVTPGGSTNIQDALITGLRMDSGSRPTYVIFLTDGLPTTGEVNSNRILENVQENAGKSIRLFAFGVGYDVDTFLLDQLASNHHGSSTYVHPGEDAEEAISSFYQKISAPVLTDLNMVVQGAGIYDVQPVPLPDLFYGSQLIITGRYRNPGSTSIKLTAMKGTTPYEKIVEGVILTDGSEPDAEKLSYLPRIWAARKIGILLNQVRIQGADKETIAQIVALSIRFGIVTPYTSYLVTEPDALGVEAQQRIAEQEFSVQAAMPTQVSGAGAVNKAADAGAMSAAENLSGAYGRGGGGGGSAAPITQDLVKTAGSRTFVLKDGIWIDTRYDPDEDKPVQIKFLSGEYFRLVKSDPDLAAGLALGPRVIIISGVQVFEVIE